MCLSVKSLQLWLTLYNPVDCGQACLSMRFSRQKYWSGWEWDRSLNPAGFRIFPTQGSNWHLLRLPGRLVTQCLKKKKIRLQYGRCRNPDLIPWIGRSPGGESGNPLQYSWLENPMAEGWRPWDCRVGHNLATDFLPFFPFTTSTTWKHMCSTVTKPEESQQAHNSIICQWSLYQNFTSCFGLGS